jgi:hypothetical protein
VNTVEPETRSKTLPGLWLLSKPQSKKNNRIGEDAAVTVGVCDVQTRTISLQSETYKLRCADSVKREGGRERGWVLKRTDSSGAVQKQP